MRKIFIIFAILLAVSLHSYAQNVSQTDNSDDKPISIKAEKVDEFGGIGNCDLSARLDNFFITLQNNSALKGVVITYQRTTVLPAYYEASTFNLYQNYISYRRFDPSRIEFIDGGFRIERTTELWIVPPGAEMPKPTQTIPKPKLPKNKTFLFDRNNVEQRFYETLELGINYNTYLDEFLLAVVKAEREAEQKTLEEEWKSENSEEPQTIEEETETEQPKTPEEVEAEKFFWLSKKFGEVIKNQKDASGVMIFYADDQVYDIGKLQTFIDEGRRKIARESKTPVSKIQILFGGYRQYTEVEFWIMPKNGKFPDFKPDERPVEETEEDLESS